MVLSFLFFSLSLYPKERNKKKKKKMIVGWKIEIDLQINIIKYLVSILDMLLFTMSDWEGFKVSFVTKIYDSCRSNNLKNND
jgi:hypothetical protein